LNTLFDYSANVGDANLDPKDIAAAVGARRELGAEYDDVIAASLVDHMEKEISNRLNQQIAQRSGPAPYQNPYMPPPKRQRDFSLGLPVLSLVAGIPITAIAGSLGHPNSVAAIFISWCGIAAVNFAHAFGRRRNNPNNPNNPNGPHR
jgi:hypothetical protein